MSVDAFAVLAEPTRRRILDRLRTSESSVGELVEVLAVSQPTVSKHLKVLRDNGFVSCRIAAQQRIYQIEVAQFEAIDRWLQPYRHLWNRHLDALERHLDDQADGHIDDQTDDQAGADDGRVLGRLDRPRGTVSTTESRPRRNDEP